MTPLQGLTALTSLYLDASQVSDLRPLRDLTALGLLGLNGTTVSDLAPLKGLTKLYVLRLPDGQVIGDWGGDTPAKRAAVRTYLARL